MEIGNPSINLANPKIHDKIELCHTSFLLAVESTDHDTIGRAGRRSDRVCFGEPQGGVLSVCVGVPQGDVLGLALQVLELLRDAPVVVAQLLVVVVELLLLLRELRLQVRQHVLHPARKHESGVGKRNGGEKTRTRRLQVGGHVLHPARKHEPGAGKHHGGKTQNMHWQREPPTLSLIEHKHAHKT